ncbi:MAG: SCO family protein [Flavisolibacter sp.]
MNRKAVYGILIAVLLPLTGYVLLKKYTDRDVVMPRHRLPDSVSTVTRNGKQYIDTIWHRVADFHFTNQLGNPVSWKDMSGKIVVADFFFTHCPTICPNMTRSMKMLQDAIKSPEKVGDRDPNFVQFLSFSIDPERDSVRELKKWNDRFQINPQEWWLLTGDKKSIYDFSIKELKLMAIDGGPTDSNFLHSDLFVVIDTNRYVRGYYHVLSPDGSIDTATVANLAQDVVMLSLEKDPKRESLLAGKLELIAIVFALAAIGVILLLTFLNRDRKKT